MADETKFQTVPDQVFVLRGKDNSEEWYALVNGVTRGVWRNKGEATAGMQVEQRRLADKRCPHCGAKMMQTGSGKLACPNE